MLSPGWQNRRKLVPRAGGGLRAGGQPAAAEIVRIHFIIVMIRWTDLAPWEFEFPVPGSLTSTFIVRERSKGERATCGG